MLQVFLCTDEDNNRILAVKEVDIDPNLTKDAKKVRTFIHITYMLCKC